MTIHPCFRHHSNFSAIQQKSFRKKLAGDSYILFIDHSAREMFQPRCFPRPQGQRGRSHRKSKGRLKNFPCGNPKSHRLRSSRQWNFGSCTHRLVIDERQPGMLHRWHSQGASDARDWKSQPAVSIPDVLLWLVKRAAGCQQTRHRSCGRPPNAAREMRRSGLHSMVSELQEYAVRARLQPDWNAVCKAIRQFVIKRPEPSGIDLASIQEDRPGIRSGQNENSFSSSGAVDIRLGVDSSFGWREPQRFSVVNNKALVAVGPAADHQSAQVPAARLGTSMIVRCSAAASEVPAPLHPGKQPRNWLLPQGGNVLPIRDPPDWERARSRSIHGWSSSWAKAIRGSIQGDLSDSDTSARACRDHWDHQGPAHKAGLWSHPQLLLSILR